MNCQAIPGHGITDSSHSFVGSVHDLGWHVVEVDGGVLLDPEPVSAAAPLVPALDDPEPLQGRVALVALAANHAVLWGRHRSIRLFQVV